MAWISEIVEARGKNSRTYQHDTDPNRSALLATLATLHYESVVDSGDYDTEVDFTPIYVTDHALLNDGWVITNAPWIKALGQRVASGTDGWIGFGAKTPTETHSVWVRLVQAGYLHWPSRTWYDRGGSPDYDRANLTRQPRTVVLDPLGDEINISTVAEWRNIFTTTGDGELWQEIIGDGDRLKINIVINQAGRDALADAYPTGNPTDETYLGFALRLDLSDIPRTYLGDVLTDPDADDFADDGEGIYLRDATDRLLALLPLDIAYVRPTDPEDTSEFTSVPIRKRVYSTGGNTYLIIGVRADLLQTLPEGDLVFDPTVNPAVGSAPDDVNEGSGGTVYDSTDRRLYASFPYAGFRIALAVPNGATVNDSHISVYGDHPALTALVADWDMVAEDNCAAWDTGTANDVSNRTLTGNPVDCSMTLSTSAYTDSSTSATDALEALFARGGWSSGNYAGIVLTYTGTSESCQYASYDDDSAKALKIYIDYTESGAGTDNLTASDLVGGTPALDSPTIGQVHGLTASDLASQAPTLEAAALGQMHALSADNTEAQAPTLDSPTIGQVHGLTANGTTAQAPILGTPTLAEGVDNLTASDLTGGTPALDSPTIGQMHALAADDTTAQAPTLDSPTIGQVHQLAAGDLASQSPTLGSPTLAEAGVSLTAEGIVAGAPVLGTPTIGQIHGLIAVAVVASAAQLGLPSLGGESSTPGRRTKTIKAEDRTVTVSGSSRVKVIDAEDRTKEI